MSQFQKAGGAAALIQALTFIVGFGLAAALLAPAGYRSPDLAPAQQAAFLAGNQLLMQLWYLTIYVVFGAFLVVQTLALHERLKERAPALSQSAAAFGLIWAGLVIATGMVAVIGIGAIARLHAVDPAQAGSLWMAFSFVVDGLGGGIEFPGGVWLLLVSLAALRTGGLPRALNYLGLLVGAAGVASAIPALAEVVAIFGLGIIVWYLWAAVAMWRGDTQAYRAPAIRQGEAA